MLIEFISTTKYVFVLLNIKTISQLPNYNSGHLHMTVRLAYVPIWASHPPPTVILYDLLESFLTVMYNSVKSYTHTYLPIYFIISYSKKSHKINFILCNVINFK